ncbi:MAG: hypothetical protein QOG20_6378 [Pseudonocardiales bacterium]|uniref:hypothetical protein n=1 Tax=Pseudonocardia sp. TaxID=60912 RepID=UPI002633DEDD|nr:hypothetical protein [Pseudonocardia sp.]MCW2722737.1 hypothetical protein [Pseudonocardia sp.]MDT7710771.1 hypothetical protein [Pseudonocardiales bacterium]
MDRLLVPFARRVAPHLGALVGLAGLCALWAIAAQSLLAGPLAIFFVGLTFWWSLTRLNPGEPRARWCQGCRAGCVECRERIDVGGKA